MNVHKWYIGCLAKKEPPPPPSNPPRLGGDRVLENAL